VKKRYATSKEKQPDTEYWLQKRIKDADNGVSNKVDKPKSIERGANND